MLGAALVSPASADVPVGWENAPDVSPLGFLLVLFIIPIGLAAVIVILTLLPSMASDKGFEAGQSWRGQPEWFGGPTQGLAAAEGVTPEQIEAGRQGTGGTSAQW